MIILINLYSQIHYSPLAQSPVKMRVEAFENAAAAASEQSKRPQRGKKENVTPVRIDLIRHLTWIPFKNSH